MTTFSKGYLDRIFIFKLLVPQRVATYNKLVGTRSNTEVYKGLRTVALLFSSTLSALETPRGVEKCFNFILSKPRKKCFDS